MGMVKDAPGTLSITRKQLRALVKGRKVVIKRNGTKTTLQVMTDVARINKIKARMRKLEAHLERLVGQPKQRRARVRAGDRSGMDPVLRA